MIPKIKRSDVKSNKTDRQKASWKSRTAKNGKSPRPPGSARAHRSPPLRLEQEIKDLEARIVLECPGPGQTWQCPSATSGDNPSTDGGPQLTPGFFSELPISKKTMKGLQQGGFTRMTAIQRLAIPHGLIGRDVLGEAQTGSGKTLAFVVPLLECLYRSRWEPGSGLGALIISPTRELATQIFDVLRVVGKFHDFSAACLIGGKAIQQESKYIDGMNIVVATPGRLLQHFDESPGFDASNLQFLVIDEADELVSLGFAETMASIMSQLPTQGRQTLLFSATLSSAVRKLALISLQNYERLSARSEGSGGGPSENGLTPARLKQHYIRVELFDQVNYLFSFLRTNSQKRVIVFVNSCKQVRFLFEMFRRLKPGPAVFGLHGRQNQQRRFDVFQAFLNKPRSAALICTDIAARGLDFPAVDWVVQMNCPSDVDTYIHRVGRTARYQNAGQAVLMLLPSEMTFLERLKEKNIVQSELFINPKKIVPIERKVASVIASDPELRHIAQRALISYLRSVSLAKDKSVFQLAKLLKWEGGAEDSEIANRFAQSLGLPAAPPVSAYFSVDGSPNESAKKKMSKLERLKEKIKQKRFEKRTEDWDSSEEDKTNQKQISKAQRRLEELRELRSKAQSNKGDVSEGTDDELLEAVRESGREAPAGEEFVGFDLNAADVRKKLRRQRIKIRADGTAKIKGLAALDKQEGRHVFFDEEEAAETKTPFEFLMSQWNEEGELTTREDFLESVRARLGRAAERDKAQQRERVQDRHLRKRLRKREERKTLDGSTATVVELRPPSDGSIGSDDGGEPHRVKRRAAESHEAPVEDLAVLEQAALSALGEI